MKPPCILVVLLAFLAGLAAGHFVGKGAPEEPGASADVVADARAALDALMKSRKQGSSIAVREAMDLVERITRGGRELLEPLAAAIRTVPYHPYNLPVSTDQRAGVPSGYSNKKIALLEAVTRIGGDRAVEILEEAVEDRTERDWGTRVAAFAFLARHADRKQVRDFYTRFVGRLLTVMRNDFVTTKVLTTSYGRLNPELFTQMSGAYRTGWATDNNADAMSVALHYLDREKAGAFFMSTLVDGSVSAPARKAAARALACTPDRRPGAARYLLDKRDPDLLSSFLNALLHHPLEYLDDYNAAKLTDDIEQFRGFCDDQIADIESREALVREMEASLGPEAADLADVPGTLRGLRDRMERMREMREARTE